MAKQKKKHLADEVTLVEENLNAGLGIDLVAFCELQEKVSPELWDLLYQMLLPFADSMQLEIADDLLDFAHGYVIHTTGCPSADAVLEVCYRWIAEERGLDEFAEKIKLYKF